MGLLDRAARLLDTTPNALLFSTKAWSQTAHRNAYMFVFAQGVVVLPLSGSPSASVGHEKKSMPSADQLDSPSPLVDGNESGLLSTSSDSSPAPVVCRAASDTFWYSCGGVSPESVEHHLEYDAFSTTVGNSASHRTTLSTADVMVALSSASQDRAASKSLVVLRGSGQMDCVLTVADHIGASRALRLCWTREMFHNVDRVALSHIMFPESVRAFRTLCVSRPTPPEAASIVTVRPSNIPPLSPNTSGPPAAASTSELASLLNAAALPSSASDVGGEAILLVVDGLIVTSHRIVLSGSDVLWRDVDLVEVDSQDPGWLTVHARCRGAPRNGVGSWRRNGFEHGAGIGAAGDPPMAPVRLVLRSHRGASEWLLSVWLDFVGRTHVAAHLPGAGAGMLRKLHGKFLAARTQVYSNHNAAGRHRPSAPAKQGAEDESIAAFGQFMLTSQQEIDEAFLPLPSEAARLIAARVGVRAHISAADKNDGNGGRPGGLSFLSFAVAAAQLFSDDFRVRLRFAVQVADADHDGLIDAAEWGAAVRLLQLCNDVLPDASSDAHAEALFKAVTTGSGSGSTTTSASGIPAPAQVKLPAAKLAAQLSDAAYRTKFLTIGATSERDAEYLTQAPTSSSNGGLGDAGTTIAAGSLPVSPEDAAEALRVTIGLSSLWATAESLGMKSTTATSIGATTAGAAAATGPLNIFVSTDYLKGTARRPSNVVSQSATTPPPLPTDKQQHSANHYRHHHGHGELCIELMEPSTLLDLGEQHDLTRDSFDADIGLGSIVATAFFTDQGAMHVFRRRRRVATGPNGGSGSSSELVVRSRSGRVEMIVVEDPKIADLWVAMLQPLVPYLVRHPNHCLPQLLAVARVSCRIPNSQSAASGSPSTSRGGTERTRWYIAMLNREATFQRRWDFPVGIPRIGLPEAHVQYIHGLAVSPNESANNNSTTRTPATVDNRSVRQRRGSVAHTSPGATTHETMRASSPTGSNLATTATLPPLDRGWLRAVMSQLESDAEFLACCGWKLLLRVTILSAPLPGWLKVSRAAGGWATSTATGAPGGAKDRKGGNTTSGMSSPASKPSKGSGGCCGKKSVEERPGASPPLRGGTRGSDGAPRRGGARRSNSPPLDISFHADPGEHSAFALSPVTSRDSGLIFTFEPQEHLEERDLVSEMDGFTRACQGALLEARDDNADALVGATSRQSSAIIFPVELASGASGSVAIDRAAKVVSILANGRLIRVISLRSTAGVHVSRPLFPVTQWSRTVAAICTDYDYLRGRHATVIPVRVRSVAEMHDLNVELQRWEQPTTTFGSPQMSAQHGWFLASARVVLMHWRLGPGAVLDDHAQAQLTSALHQIKGSHTSQRSAASNSSPQSTLDANTLFVISTTENAHYPDDAGNDAWLEAVKRAVSPQSFEGNRYLAVVGDVRLQGHRLLVMATRTLAPRISSVRGISCSVTLPSSGEGGDREEGSVVALSCNMDFTSAVFLSIACPPSTAVTASLERKSAAVERLLFAASAEFREALGTDILNAHFHQFVLGDFFFGWKGSSGSSTGGVGAQNQATGGRNGNATVLSTTAQVLTATPQTRRAMDTFQGLLSERVFLNGFAEPPPGFQPTSFYVPERVGEKRVYDQASPIPAHWASRIAHRRLPHRIEEARCEAYDAQAITRTSAHDAVFASYDLTLRNRYMPRRERTAKVAKILITQLSCRGLAIADGRFQQSDPFIRFLSPLLAHEVITPPQFQTLNPVWRETFELVVELVEPEQLNAAYVTCVINDVDIVGAPEPLGEAVLPLELVDPSGAATYAATAPVVRHGMQRGTLFATIRFVLT